MGLITVERKNFNSHVLDASPLPRALLRTLREDDRSSGLLVCV